MSSFVVSVRFFPGWTPAVERPRFSAPAFRSQVAAGRQVDGFYFLESSGGVKMTICHP